MLNRIFFDTPQKVMYTNWKGVTRERTIVAKELYLGQTEYHPDEQWILRAVDLEKDEVRDFALADLRPLTGTK